MTDTKLLAAAAEIDDYREINAMNDLLFRLSQDGEDYDLHAREMHLLIRFAEVGHAYMAAVDR